jgi:hypothetical protein
MSEDSWEKIIALAKSPADIAFVCLGAVIGIVVSLVFGLPNGWLLLAGMFAGLGLKMGINAVVEQRRIAGAARTESAISTTAKAQARVNAESLRRLAQENLNNGNLAAGLSASIEANIELFDAGLLNAENLQVRNVELADKYRVARMQSIESGDDATSRPELTRGSSRRLVKVPRKRREGSHALDGPSNDIGLGSAGEVQS